MTLRIIPLMMIMVATGFFYGCNSSGGDGDDDGGGGGSSMLEVMLRGVSTDDDDTGLAKVTPQSLKRIVQSNHETDCVAVAPNGPPGGVSGACLTPEKISGTVWNVSLGRQTGSAPGRLLGSGQGLGRDGEIGAQAFDLANPATLEGEDNIEDDDGANWNMVYANFYHLDLKFELNGKYWNVRHAFVTNPVIDDPIIDACLPTEGESSGYRQDVIDNGHLIDGVSFQKGDLLFCVKDDDSDCADDEFRWLDLGAATANSLAFVDERGHANMPRQVQIIADHLTTCAPSQDGPGYDTILGGFRMFAWVHQPFLLSAEFPPNSDVKVYTYSDDDGATTVEGTEITVYIDFDVTNAVFFPSVASADLGTMSDEEIAEAVFLKPLYIKDNAPEGDGYDPGIRAGVKITLAGDPPPPPIEPDEGETPE